MNNPDSKIKKITVSCKERGSIAPSLSSLLFSIVLVCVMSCATPVQIIREQSAKERPLWINTPPNQEGQLFFVGVSTSGESFEKARDDAMKDAVSKISNYLGTTVSSSFESYSTESEHRLRIHLKAKSSALVYGATLVATYFEKAIRNDPKFRIEKYDVYVLMSFSKEKVEMEMQRQKEEKESKIKSAKELFENGRRYESQADYLTAIRYYSDSLQLLEIANGIINANKADDSSCDELGTTLKQRIIASKSLLMTASFKVNIQASIEGEKAFIAHFTSGFSSKGFSITHYRPQFDIRIDVSVRQGGFVMNNHVGYASGSVVVIRRADGMQITEFPFNTKGFHKDLNQSFVNALAEAGDDAGVQVADCVMRQLNFN